MSRGVGLVGRAVETGWGRCSEPRKARRGVVSSGGVETGWGRCGEPRKARRGVVSRGVGL